MTSIKSSEIRNMTAVEIEARIEEVEEELFRLRFRNRNQGIDNPLRIRYLHRDIARMKTALRENKTGRHKLPE
jgi:large subunit ribosomal protein L29